MKVKNLNHGTIAIMQIVIAAAGLMFCTSPVLGAEQTDSAASLFNEKCSGCHTIGGGSLVGPDLAPVATWSQTDVTTAVKRMEKNVGPLSDSDVRALTKFLKDQSAAELIKKVQLKAATPIQSEQIEKGSADMGKQLFEGKQSFVNRGIACIACHQVDDIGGTMAPDLTNIATKMGEGPLASACQQTSFKVMKAAYHEHPVTKQEALDLTAYFVSLKNPHNKKAGSLVPLWGASIATLVLILIGIGYRNRHTSIRAKLRRR